MDEEFVTTSFSFDGYVIKEYLGIASGITVISRSILGNIHGGLQTLVGGNISVYTELCEKTRQEPLSFFIKSSGKPWG